MQVIMMQAKAELRTARQGTQSCCTQQLTQQHSQMMQMEVSRTSRWVSDVRLKAALLPGLM